MRFVGGSPAGLRHRPTSRVQAAGPNCSGDAWPIIWGMRNRIAHGYLLVDTDIVRRTVEHDIPPILTSIEAELDQRRLRSKSADVTGVMT